METPTPSLILVFQVGVYWFEYLRMKNWRLDSTMSFARRQLLGTLLGAYRSIIVYKVANEDRAESYSFSSLRSITQGWTVSASSRLSQRTRDSVTLRSSRSWLSVNELGWSPFSYQNRSPDHRQRSSNKRRNKTNGYGGIRFTRAGEQDTNRRKSTHQLREKEYPVSVSYALFLSGHASMLPWRRFRNCWAMMQAKVGPTMPPTTGFSAMPPANKSISITCR